jgi:DNA-binding GntR family transcriptional regulator
VEEEAAAHARGDEPSRIEHSLAIHHLLAEHSSNRVLGAMLTDLILRTSIVIALYKRAGLASCYLAEDHPALLDHLRSGDGEAARRCIHDHLQALEGLLDLTTREARIDLMAILGQREGVTS